MVIEPEQIPANGQPSAEISVWVYEASEGGTWPLPNVYITIESSRNQFGSKIDIIEQPTGPTDADGRVVAFLSSSTPGETLLMPILALREGEVGAPLCKTWDGLQCAEDVTVMVFFE